MTLPPPRVQEVLALMRDLHPEQARLLLRQVVSTLDAAEVLALRTYLPAAAVHCLPGEVATVMNRAPMPWELPVPPPAPAAPPRQIGVETGELIRAALPSPSPRRLRALAATAVCALAIGGSLAWRSGGADAEPPPPAALVPLPRVTEYAPMSAPKIARGKKPAGKATARKPAATVARSPRPTGPAPFEARE